MRSLDLVLDECPRFGPGGCNGTVGEPRGSLLVAMLLEGLVAHLLVPGKGDASV